MPEESWESYAKRLTKQIESELKTVLSDLDIPERLVRSMGYSLFAGGKRIRPIMVLTAAQALGGNIHSAMPIACAVEMVHTYSLIHDDLPAMDNDDYRRGMLTNHKVFGEAMAILAGDALLTHAFHTAAKALDRNVPAEQVLQIIRELSYYAGPAGMVGGQTADMDGEQGITSLEQLQYIHTHKTSDLIICSLRSGGYAAGGTEEQLQALGDFGRHLGLAFQIQDDILDITGDSLKLGKEAGSDERQNKVTYPFFLGIEASRELVQELTRKAVASIAKEVIPYPQRLLQLADYLMNRDH